jgi:hypothetical protein
MCDGPNLVRYFFYRSIFKPQPLSFLLPKSLVHLLSVTIVAHTMLILWTSHPLTLRKSTSST